MNNNDSITEIKRVLEKIRTEKYPQIPAELVAQIVDQHAANTDSDAASLNLAAVKKMVYNYLDTIN